ncbi:AzlD domain-containing protein [Streptomyces sp. L7]
MTNTPLLIGAMLVLAVGTYAFRLAGPGIALQDRVPARAGEASRSAPRWYCSPHWSPPPRCSRLRSGRGWPAPVGVLVGGLLAWRKVPFVVVVLAAAACTALLRLAGVS